MADKSVILGKITGVQGVRGWLRVFSHTRPLENIFQFKHWKLRDDSGGVISRTVVEHKHQGKKILVKLQGVDERTAAEGLVGLEIFINEDQLPALTDEYYWRELIGLTVKDIHGVELGEIIDLMETGSNDVLLLKDSNGKSLAIPWLPEVVIKVDIEQSFLIADWEPLI
ncbi:MAG: 16S rRNA processing protein RimM [Proteobacteria bacterium]|nr:16S rRNA processing protein RimM [Pseudomonadota bacterium]